MRRSALVPLLLATLLLPALPAVAQVSPPAKAAAASFKEMDANRDGRVSLDEVMACAKKRSSAVTPFRISDVDTDGDGRLTQEELRKAGIKGLEDQGTIDARELDAVTPDGYVTSQDLDEYFRRKHRQAFAKADADKDGTLRQSEFALFRF